MVNSHPTQAYAMLMNHNRLLHRGGFTTYSKSSLVIAKNMGYMKLQDYVLSGLVCVYQIFGPQFHVEDALLFG